MLLYLDKVNTCVMRSSEDDPYNTHRTREKQKIVCVLLYSEGLRSSPALCWDFPRLADLIRICRNIYRAIQNSACAFFFYFLFYHRSSIMSQWRKQMGKTCRPKKSLGFPSITQMHNIHFIRNTVLVMLVITVQKVRGHSCYFPPAAIDNAPGFVAPQL